METNTPRHCIHGVLENCCNVCDKDIDPCPSCKEHEAVEGVLAAAIIAATGKDVTVEKVIEMARQVNNELEARRSASGGKG